MHTITDSDIVLFVDDEESILKAIDRSLSDVRFSTMFCSDSMQVMDMLEQHRINVVVTDLKMPGKNGIELVRMINAKFPHIRIIVLSGYYQVSTVMSVTRAGKIFHFFTKPWKMDNEFISVIEKAIISSRESRESADGLSAQV
ncbi:response regulator [Seleniivibrio woodruffii]|uniref:Response regulator receiver domain-containing protein n=1 Tax=Seleniivibrio woodruffii TaxID=1078050 RepID=A0A4R1K7D7_9BACT|nr:response regulator [Seleniivibrio woodruffii]TCK59950.1 response regulator receiver domain-containing protein [Seleniivibrio woodruffii]TVZ35829.1 response regulator receiver domain-containing protein [Seleniivibrio woodruffii]